MENELKNIIEIGKNRMDSSINNFKKKLSKINIGNSSIYIIEYIKIEYSGIKLTLKEIATINVIDSMTLSIKPWDKNMLLVIYKSIIKLNYGFNTINNGDNIVIKMPTMTEERRKKIVKEVKSEYEQYKITLRNIRKYMNNKINLITIIDEDLLNKYENKIQEITLYYIKELEQIYFTKTKDIINP